MAALELVEARPELVRRLQANALTLRRALEQEGLTPGGSSSHIIPLILGDAEVAVRAGEKALQQGVFAQAIRPPTVPPMTSRLRLAVMASHRTDELRRAAQVLADVTRQVIPAPRTVEEPEPAEFYGGSWEYEEEPAHALAVFDAEADRGARGELPPRPARGGVFDVERLAA
jgi:glycine C-acetyltransferase/8-amino-7-oxononanoate synthase